VATLMARDRGGPTVIFQLLEIPSTDSTMSQPSMKTLANGYIVTAAVLAQGYDYYLPPGVDRSHPYASPLLAEDLAGLPPAMVLTCEYDPLRDEGEAYARRLRAAGVAVQAIRAKGHIHSSTYSSSRLLPSARRYQLMTARALHRAYERVP
jgi:acetyl esterase